MKRIIPKRLCSNLPPKFIMILGVFFVGLVVGSDNIGIRVNNQKKLTKTREQISNKNEIGCMEWANESCSEIVIGYKNKVQLYDTSLDEFTHETSSTDHCICGVLKDDE